MANNNAAIANRIIFLTANIINDSNVSDLEWTARAQENDRLPFAAQPVSIAYRRIQAQLRSLREAAAVIANNQKELHQTANNVWEHIIYSLRDCKDKCIAATMLEIFANHSAIFDKILQVADSKILEIIAGYLAIDSETWWQQWRFTSHNISMLADHNRARPEYHRTVERLKKTILEQPHIIEFLLTSEISSNTKSVLLKINTSLDLKYTRNNKSIVDALLEMPHGQGLYWLLENLSTDELLPIFTAPSIQKKVLPALYPQHWADKYSTFDSRAHLNDKRAFLLIFTIIRGENIKTDKSFAGEATKIILDHMQALAKLDFSITPREKVKAIIAENIVATFDFSLPYEPALKLMEKAVELYFVNIFPNVAREYAKEVIPKIAALLNRVYRQNTANPATQAQLTAPRAVQNGIDVIKTAILEILDAKELTIGCFKKENRELLYKAMAEFANNGNGLTVINVKNLIKGTIKKPQADEAQPDKQNNKKAKP